MKKNKKLLKSLLALQIIFLISNCTAGIKNIRQAENTTITPLCNINENNSQDNAKIKKT